MKKGYIAPSIVFEHYELDTSIASNCHVTVNNGPAMGPYELCEDYAKKVGAMASTLSVRNVMFYENLCDCYTTGGNFGFWTS